MYDCLHVCVHSLMINCTADTMHDTEISPGHTRQLNSTSIKVSFAFGLPNDSCRTVTISTLVLQP